MTTIDGQNLTTIYQLLAGLSIAFGTFFYIHDSTVQEFNTFKEIISETMDKLGETSEGLEEKYVLRLAEISRDIGQFERGPFVKGFSTLKNYVCYGSVAIYLLAIIILEDVSSNPAEKFPYSYMMLAVFLCLLPILIAVLNFFCASQTQKIIASVRARIRELERGTLSTDADDTAEHPPPLAAGG